RFGEVLPIGRDDYTREVTEASKVDDEEGSGRGTGVVCFLYKDGIPRSDRTTQHVRQLSRKHPRTKFVSIVGDKCLPNLPDSRVPMFIVYRCGEIVTQITSWGADRERTAEGAHRFDCFNTLEALLILCGAVVPPERSLPTKKSGESDEESGDEGGDRSAQMRSRATRTNYSAKNVRGSSKQDDSDSDFDM
ncbi:hypothetical protein K488DRAFT_38545, partial [Vararia minispora EC-137]